VQCGGRAVECVLAAAKVVPDTAHGLHGGRSVDHVEDYR
jgi:hypothetical protein